MKLDLEKTLKLERLRVIGVRYFATKTSTHEKKLVPE